MQEGLFCYIKLPLGKVGHARDGAKVNNPSWEGVTFH
jgi:hypothetical protein